MFAFFILNEGESLGTFAAHSYPKFAGVLPSPGDWKLRRSFCAELAAMLSQNPRGGGGG